MMQFLFSGNGRVSRKAFWLFNLALIGISLVVAIIDLVLFGTAIELEGTGPISIVFTIVSIWPSIAVTVKRFHDRGMSGWWILWFLLFVFAGGVAGGVITTLQSTFQGEGQVMLGSAAMVIGIAIPIIWQFIILMLLPGQKGPNKYGPNPLEPFGEGIARTFD